LRADARKPQARRIDQPHRVGHLAAQAAALLGQHRFEQAGKDPEIPVTVGVGEGRAFRRERARMIEPALMARHRRFNAAQRTRAAQLREQKRVQVLPGGEAARPPVSPVLVHQSVERRPRHKFQKIVKDAIPVPHGLGPFVSR
jgi:hypothetical protein